MTDIMKLADDYATAKAEHDFLADQGTSTEMRDDFPALQVRVKHARAALQSAIDALQAENERLKQDRDEWRDSTIAANQNAASEEKRRRDMQEQRDQLQAKLDELQRQEPVLFIHPSTFSMDSAHVGAWKPGHELAGYLPLYATPKALDSAGKNANLLDAVRAERDALRGENERLREMYAGLKKMIDDGSIHERIYSAGIELERRNAELQAKLDETAKQEPVAVVDANDDGYWADILPDRSVKVGQQLYAAPKALEPLTEAMRKDIAMQCAKLDWEDDYSASVGKVIDAAEAAHGITKGTHGKVVEWPSLSEQPQAQIEELVREIHQAIKRGRSTEDHGLMGNLRCILDHVLPDPDAHSQATEPADQEAVAVAKLKAMSDQQRKSVFSNFCHHCGSENPRCFCWNDD